MESDRHYNLDNIFCSCPYNSLFYTEKLARHNCYKLGICFNQMNKRGEISSSQIVGIVLAIGALIIITLFFGAFFNQGELINREACHLSVLKRATLPFGSSLSPLDCVSDKVCISQSGDKDACAQFVGEEPVRGISINLDNIEESRGIIERETANSFFDCWSVMGEGKIDVLTKNTQASVKKFFGVEASFSVSEPMCLVCSRIAIAEDVLSDTRGQAILEQVDVNEYMRTHAVPGSEISYLETFTDRNARSYAGVDKYDESAFTDINGDLSFGVPQKSSQIGIIFMQIKSDVDPASAAADVALGSLVVGGGGVLTSPGRFVAVNAVKSIGGIATLVVLGSVVAGTSGFAAYQAHQSQLISAGYCGEFESSDGKSKIGCSLVRGVNWDLDTVNSLCYGGIEGIL